MSPVGSIASCLAGNKSTIFYVDDGDYVHAISASQETERGKSKGRTSYNDTLVTLSDGTEIQSKTKELAALSFPLQDGTIRSRLYYADENGILQGLDRDGNEPNWNRSSIGQLGAQVVEGSSISALVSPPSDSIKVYYFTPGKEKPQVAWWSGSGGAWDAASTS